MKKTTFLFALLLCVALAACGRPDPTPTPSSEPSAEPSAAVTAPVEPTPTQAAEQTATLYIGTKAGGFTEYPMTYDGELTPEALIQGISDLTGWDLTLEGEVITGKGGMSVCFSEASALFVGPPDPQKEEFHMYDVGQLSQTILDSIQKTLQEGFTLEGGDPDALDIWYYLKGEKPLELPALNLSWPLDQPYQWENGEAK